MLLGRALLAVVGFWQHPAALHLQGAERLRLAFDPNARVMLQHRTGDP